MAYPAIDYDPIPSDISGWTVIDSHTTFTVDTEVNATIYRKGITVNGCDVTVGSDGVWIYRADPANPPQPVRLLNGGSFSGAKVKIGYDGTVVSGYDPIGGSHDVTDYECKVITSENGEFHITEFLFTHIDEGPTLQEERCTLDYGAIGPFAIVDEAAHADVFQTTGYCNADITRVRINATHASGSLTEKSIQAFQIETTLADMVRLYVNDCFVSWQSVNAINGDANGGNDILEMIFTNNVFDAASDDNNKAQDPFGSLIREHLTTRYENRWSDTGTLIPNDQAAPGASMPTHVATGTNTGTETVVMTLPSGGSTGDLIVVDVFQEDDQAVAGTTDWSAPAGDDWNQIEESDGTHSSSDAASFWRYQKAGDTPGSTTFTFTADPAKSNLGCITVYSDVAASSPIVDFGTASDAFGTTVTPATVTTTADDQLIRVAISTRGGSATDYSAVAPASQNERADFGSGRHLAVFDFVQATTGTPTLTYSSNVADIHQSISYAIAGAATVPAQPTGATAVALSSTSIKVDWTDNASDETGYRVERSPNGTDSWTNVSGSLAAGVETYTDTGLTTGTTYYYRVYAFNDSGDSDPSSTVSATAGQESESFTTSGTWDWEAAGSPETVNVLIVGGGGGGGGVTSNRAGGGGGAGGARWVTDVAVAANVSVTVGAGGAGGAGGASGTNGANGSASSFGAESAAGGGGGGFTASNGSNGASGGGAGTSGSTASTGGTGTGGQGFAGGANSVAGGPGGGGGASEVGADGSGSAAGAGGDGLDMSATFGTSVGDSGVFAGGGGGGGNTETAGAGGAGGGGDGGFAGAGNAGTANTGGGGGGAAINAEDGGAGGSGIVIVQWVRPAVSASGNRIGGTGAIRRPPRYGR